MSEHPAVWQQILQELRQVVNQQTYDTWFSQTECLSVDGEVLHLQGPNQFFVDWLTEHHLQTLEQAAARILGHPARIEVHVDSKAAAAAATFDAREVVTRQRHVADRPARTPQQVGLNPRYTFHNFVVGDNNRLAHAACRAVAENPAHAYNPLFLYGGVGLGKTHMMQAIGNTMLETDSRMLVHYVSAENFMNELIQSIRAGKTIEFKNRYRTVDLLLIDDIQFLAGKESTQEEFFHTFNALYDADKQIVVSSDRPPREIPTLEERLRSRFEWGLITDLQAPNLETRIAILKKKVEKEKSFIPDDVLLLIAESITSNIRELEGALIRLLAFASLTRSDINVEMASEVLGTFLKSTQQRRAITLAEVIKTVSDHYGVSIDLLRSKLRTKPVAHARQVAMFLCRELTDASLNQIGRKLGNRDHTTVRHAFTKISKLAEDNGTFHRELQDLRQSLLAR